jgi:hypothetical protein
VSEQKKPPPEPPAGFSRFREFLEKLAKVPKSEIDEKERQYQEEKGVLRKKQSG